MSFITPEGTEDGGQEVALRPSGALTLGPALIERTALAIEAEVRRAAYLSMVNEAFAVTDGPSPNLSFLDGPSVRASATGRAGASDVQPALRRDL